METHPADTVALIAGLFFGLSGLAILADQQWDDVDVTAFTAAGVMLIGLLLAAMIVARYVGEQTRHESDTDGRAHPEFEPTPDESTDSPPATET